MNFPASWQWKEELVNNNNNSYECQNSSDCFLNLESGQNAGPTCSQRASKTARGRFQKRRPSASPCADVKGKAAARTFSNLPRGQSPHMQLPDTSTFLPVRVSQTKQICILRMWFLRREGSDMEGSPDIISA